MKTRIVVFVALLATLLYHGLWWESSLLPDADHKIFDRLNEARGAAAPSFSTVIVEIDEKSLAELGQWPWPRVVMAELLTKISAMNPSATAVDVAMPEADRTSLASVETFYRDFFALDVSVSGLPEALRDNDRLLAETLRGRNVTLPFFFDPSGGSAQGCFLPAASRIPLARMPKELYAGSRGVCNLPLLQHAAAGIGHIQASPDHDGILRRVALFIRYGDVAVPALGVASLLSIDPAIRIEAERGGGIRTELFGHTVRGDGRSEVLLRFAPRESYPVVSALDLLSGRADRSLFEGKIVFVGATAMGLHDHYLLSDGTLRAGVFVHATLVENLLGDALVVQPGVYKPVAFALSAVASIVLLLLMLSRKYWQVVAFFSLSVAAAAAVSYGMMERNVYVSAGYFIVPFTVYLFGLSLVLFLLYYRDRKRFFEKMSKANEAVIDAMALVAETRDTETGAHIVRTKEYIRALAGHLASRGHSPDILTEEYITNLYHAAPLHDVGKVGIPDDILKKNAKLSYEEFEVMKTHTTMGRDIIDNAMHAYKNTSMLEIAYNIARSHHEKWDGSGYPGALSGEEIPLEARMMALADVYDALISRRRYKEPFSFEEAESIIREGSGSHFDPLLVEAFVAIREEFRAIARRATIEV